MATNFLAAKEHDPVWLTVHARDLTDVEWAAVARHSARYVDSGGEIRVHVTAELAFSEADRRGALAGHPDAVNWRRFRDAGGMMTVVTNAALALLTKHGGGLTAGDPLFIPIEAKS